MRTDKTYGTVSAIRRKEMSGLEFVQGLADGTLPLNTIARTLGYDVTEAASGRVVITAEPSDDHLNPAGTVHGGFSATLLDSCMGLAIQSTLEKGLRLDDAGVQDFAGAADHARDRRRSGPRALCSAAAGGSAPPKDASRIARDVCSPRAPRPA